MSEVLRKKLRGLIDHAVHPKHREEPEGLAKATAACDLLNRHWDEFFSPSPIETAKTTKPGVGVTFAKHEVESKSAYLEGGKICSACDRPIELDSPIHRHKPGTCDVCRGTDRSLSTLFSKEELLVHSSPTCREWLRDHLLERERKAPKTPFAWP